MFFSVLLIACCLFLPGFSLSLVLFPRLTSLNFIERFGISVGLSFVIISITGLFLIVTHGFTGPVIYLCLGLETSLFFAISAIRCKVLNEIRNYFFEKRFFGDKTLLFAALVIMVVACISIKFINKEVSIDPTPCFYIAQAKLITQTGDFSGKMFQWGRYREVLWGKMFFNLVTAVVLEITNLDYIEVMRVMSFIFLLMAVVCAFIFYNQFFSTIMSVCGILATFANPLFARFVVTKFLIFRGESSGIMLIFLFLYTFSKAFFEKDRKFFAISIVILITMGVWHGVSFVIGMMVFICFYISRWIINLRVAWAEVKSFILLMVFVPLGIICVLLMARAFHFHKIVKSAMSSESRVTLYQGRYDPTWEFQAKVSGYNHRGIKQGSGFYRPAKNIYEWAIMKALYIPRGFVTRRYFLLEFTVVAITVLSFLLWRIEKKSKILLLALIGLFITIILMGLYFSYKYSTYIPAEHVMRREINYCFLPGIIILLICCSYLKKLIVPKKGIIFDIILVLVCCVYFLPLTNSFLDDFERVRRSEGNFLSDDGLQAMKWLKDNTGEEEIIMANQRTGATFYLFAERKAISEGKAPYLEKEFLMEVLEVMDDIQLFFRKPNRHILEKYDIRYILVAPRGGLAGLNLVRNGINKRAIDNVGFLQKVRAFGTIEIYRCFY